MKEKSRLNLVIVNENSTTDIVCHRSQSSFFNENIVGVYVI